MRVHVRRLDGACGKYISAEGGHDIFSTLQHSTDHSEPGTRAVVVVGCVLLVATAVSLSLSFSSPASIALARLV